MRKGIKNKIFHQYMENNPGKSQLEVLDNPPLSDDEEAQKLHAARFQEALAEYENLPYARETEIDRLKLYFSIL